MFMCMDTFMRLCDLCVCVRVGVCVGLFFVCMRERIAACMNALMYVHMYEHMHAYMLGSTYVSFHSTWTLHCKT